MCCQTFAHARALCHCLDLSNEALYEVFPQGASKYHKSDSKYPKKSTLLNRFGSQNL